VNNGGDLIEHGRSRRCDKRIPYKKVTASRGKRIRAEPVAALYEQGRVFHAWSPFPDLEDQLVGQLDARQRRTAPTASTRWSGR
jgi:phage terminase large subunit-like protein